MKFLIKNAFEIAAVVVLAGFCVQWTLMGLDIPADGFAEMKRAALSVDVRPDKSLSGDISIQAVERVALLAAR